MMTSVCCCFSHACFPAVLNGFLAFLNDFPAFLHGMHTNCCPPCPRPPPSPPSPFGAQMLAAGTRLQDTAVSLFPVFLFFFIAFGGMIVRLPTLPSYLHAWAPTISFVRWAMEVRFFFFFA